MEKETLKKYLLLFGYGRWKTIKERSHQTDKILSNKPAAELQAYAEDFVRTLFFNLQTDKNELKLFLISLISPDGCLRVKKGAKDWGDAI
jgi:hypothetical protein